MLHPHILRSFCTRILEPPFATISQSFPSVPCKGGSCGCLSHVCHGTRLSASCVRVTEGTILWLPCPGVLWDVRKGLHGGTGLWLVGLSCRVHIRHSPRNKQKPLFPHSSVSVYIVTTMEGHRKSAECLIYVSPKKNGWAEQRELIYPSYITTGI